MGVNKLSVTGFALQTPWNLCKGSTEHHSLDIFKWAKLLTKQRGLLFTGLFLHDLAALLDVAPITNRLADATYCFLVVILDVTIDHECRANELS